jgi:hypothetical protein
MVHSPLKPCCYRSLDILNFGWELALHLRYILTAKGYTDMTKQLHVFSTIMLCLVMNGCSDGKRDSEKAVEAGKIDTPDAPVTQLDKPEPEPPADSPPTQSGEPRPSKLRELVLRQVSGAAVKGPLVYASVTAYNIDLGADDLKGDAVAVGMTDQYAALQLGIPENFMLQGPFLLEFINGKELDGSTPAVPKLTTLVNREQILNGTSIYATPVTDFVLRYAKHIADRPDSSNSIKTAGNSRLQGNGDGTISVTEFNAALDIASEHFKVTLGAGNIPESLDLFTTSPILSTQSRQQDSLVYRTVSETFSALIVELQKASRQKGVTLEANTAIDALALDLSDGIIDGSAAGEDVAPLRAISDIAAVVSTDPAQLKVPGTSTNIGDIDQIMATEAARVAPKVVASALQKPKLSPAVTSLPPAPAPIPVPAPVPMPVPAPEPKPEPAPQPAPGTEPAAKPTPAPVTRSVTLKWTPPATRENGAYLSLSEISSYEIYYAAELSGKESTLSISDASVSTYKVSSLPPDIYHFSMSAIDTKSVKSKMSDVVEIDLR